MTKIDLHEKINNRGNVEQEESYNTHWGNTKARRKGVWLIHNAHVQRKTNRLLNFVAFY
jgi:hypothetical protein